MCQNDLKIIRKDFFEAPDHDIEPFTIEEKNKIILSLLESNDLLPENNEETFSGYLRP